MMNSSAESFSGESICNNSSTTVEKKLFNVSLVREFMLGLNPDVYQGFHLLATPVGSNSLSACFVSGKTVVIETITYDDTLGTSDSNERFRITSRKQELISSSKCCEKITAITVNKEKTLIAIAEKTDGETKGAVVCIYDIISKRKRKILHCNDENIDYVKRVNFSSDSKRCVLLGGEPKYYCEYWDIERNARIIASTKLASSAEHSVEDASISPIDNSLVCIAGNGVLRVFRIVDAHFRNITLSDARPNPKDISYNCHCWLSNGNIVIGTSRGYLFLVDSFEITTMPSSFKRKFEGKITSIVTTMKGLIVGTSSGEIQIQEEKGSNDLFQGEVHDIVIEREGHANIFAMDIAPSQMFLGIATTNRKSYFLSLSKENPTQKGQNYALQHFTEHLHRTSNSPLPGKIVHLDACLCKPYLAICGDDRVVYLWNYSTKMIKHYTSLQDQPLCVSFHPSGQKLSVMFRKRIVIFSVLLDSLSKSHEIGGNKFESLCYSFGGHFLAIYDENHLIIRDSNTFDIRHTFRGHNCNECKLFWEQLDHQICAIYSDGTFAIWNLSDGTKVKDQGIPISSGQSFGSIVPDFSSLFVSDRNGQLINYDICTMQSKVMKDIQCECILLGDDFCLVGHFGSIDVADSSFSIEKTINCHSGRICTLQRCRDIVFSTGDDGSVGMFRLEFKKPIEGPPPFLFDDELVPDSFIYNKYCHIQKLHDEIERLQIDGMARARALDKELKISLEAINDKYAEKISIAAKNYENMCSARDDIESDCKKSMDSLSEDHQKKLLCLEKLYSQKLEKENFRRCQLLSNFDIFHKECLDKESVLQGERVAEIDSLSLKYNTMIENVTIKRNSLLADRKNEIRNADERNQEMESLGDSKYIKLRSNFESRLSADQENSRRLKEEGEIMKIKLNEMQKDLKDLAETIGRYKNKERDLKERESDLINEIATTKEEIRNKTEMVSNIEKATLDAENVRSKLESTRFSLEEDLKLVQTKLKPIEKRLEDMKIEVRNKTIEIDESRKKNEVISIQKSNLSKKLDVAKNEALLLTMKIENNNEFLEKIAKDLNEASQCKDRTTLKCTVLRLHQTYANTSSLEEYEKQNNMAVDMNEKIATLRKKVMRSRNVGAKGQKYHDDEVSRLKKQKEVLTKELKNLRGRVHSCNALVNPMQTTNS